MLASATSDWGLGREVPAASVFRVRIGPECPVDILRELCEIATQTEGSPERKKRKEKVPMKDSTLQPGPLTEQRIEGIPKER